MIKQFETIENIEIKEIFARISRKKV